MNLIAVTACPTGIAHSQMAAENLENTAEELGHEIKVEVEGAMGTENELSGDDIAAADAVIIAADTTVHTDRFEGVPVIKGTVKDAVNDPADLIHRAEEEAGGEGDSSDESDVTEATGDPTDATASTDAAGTQDDREPASEPPASPDADSGAEAETATAGDEQSSGRSGGRDRERQGIVGKIKSLFS